MSPLNLSAAEYIEHWDPKYSNATRQVFPVAIYFRPHIAGKKVEV